MRALLNSQYAWVQASREVLLQYCASLSEEDFLSEHSVFGRGSIRNLLVHIANTYEFWIGKQALNRPIDFTDYSSVKNVHQAVILFTTVDKLMDEFLNSLENDPCAEIAITLNERTQSVSTLKLFTHVLTHEFHHKGQILSLSRQLGYIPVDTDIVR
ncbi:DinB family protein [Catalinimonas niigatensis]|uniref:DinB family protein n=1 Tax=Catalinimonas niigatensis TaxID=1397264 RepID=UPI002665D561|nr:DinB family protein [Catalinimonas niigatensis]WPP50361.1 DinB family protein [Catalinimonas niigatensis]